MKQLITGEELKSVGFKEGRIIGMILEKLKQYPGLFDEEILLLLKKLRQYPENFLDDEVWNDVATAMVEEAKAPVSNIISLMGKGKEYRVYGEEFIEAGARDQMNIAMKLPGTVAGALMPDAQFENKDELLNIDKGQYLAFLTHSGSRGFGATIAGHYTKVAKELCSLPKEAANLAYLDLNSEAGQEYWLAMNLAGDYASACHEVIHNKMLAAVGAKLLKKIENHHNFAWKEKLNGEEVIVHRKGATPAGKGVLGIIPGSMTAPGFLVRGKGEMAAINSASHGAGRQMSRTQAIKQITHQQMKSFLKDHGVTLIGAGLDEAPMAYKDINKVMQAQEELVDVLAKFTPKMVRMADDGSRED